MVRGLATFGKSAMIMHDWTAKHWIIASIIIIVAMGAFKQPFGVLCRAALPFIVLMLACLALVIAQPWIALGLVK